MRWIKRLVLSLADWLGLLFLATIAASAAWVVGAWWVLSRP